MFGMNKLPLAFVLWHWQIEFWDGERDTYLWCIMKSKSWKWTCSLRFKGLIVNSYYLPFTKHESRQCHTVSFLSMGLVSVAIVFWCLFMKASIGVVIRCLITDLRCSWLEYFLFLFWMYSQVTGYCWADEINSKGNLVAWKICFEVYCKGHWEYWFKLQLSSDLLVWNGIRWNFGESLVLFKLKPIYLF